MRSRSWYYTDDQHLAITGGNQCLDSGGAGAAQVQTYQVCDLCSSLLWSY
jgi:hypothetical protein